MASWLRFHGMGLLIAASTLGVAVARPGWLEVVGIDVAVQARSCGQVLSGPDPVCEVIRQRMEAKLQVVDRLNAGDLTLFEAAAWFGYLNQEPTEYPDRQWRQLPGQSDEEKLCRQVMSWAKHNDRAVVSESEVEERLGRLEAELAARLCQCGRVDLPALR